jgi:hypothetical protein
MSFTISAIRAICRWEGATEKDTIQNWSKLTNEQLARRICRFAGVTLGDTLESKGDLDELCRLLCNVLGEQLCSRSKEYQLRHQQLYAAVWAYILPAEGWARPRSHRTIWQMQMCLGVCNSIHNLRRVDSKPAYRKILRMLPKEVQYEILEGRTDSKALATFIFNNFQMLRGKIDTEAALYVGIHARSKVWYVGRTSINRTRGKKVWYGPAVRWMEHFTSTFARKTGDQARR